MRWLLKNDSLWQRNRPGRRTAHRRPSRRQLIPLVEGFEDRLLLSGGNPAGTTLWSSSATPQNPAEADSSAVEVGVKFTADVAGEITGIRFYKDSTNTGTHVGNLWTADGTLLASATFSGETASGWQQVNFATPVAIQPNTVYVASYHTDVGHYAEDDNYFTSGVDSGPLHALADGASGPNGVYAYGSTSTFPATGYQASNYWVDVVFASNTLQFEQVASSSGSVAAGNTFLSMVLDNSPNGQTAIWDKLFVSKADLPTGVSLDVQVRTGNTPNPNDGTWSLWTAVNHGDAVPNANARYLQYQVSLSIPPGQTVQMPVDFEIDVTSVANTKAHESTNNDQVTSLPTVSAPVLAGIAAPVTVGDSGVPPTEPLVSDNVYDAGQGNVWQSLSWTAPSLPSNATLVVEVSTGYTATPDRTWSAWTPVSNGGDLLVPGEYLQYRIWVLTADSSLALATVPVNISLISDPVGLVTSTHFPGSQLPVTRYPE